jgi:hypothetical protein
LEGVALELLILNLDSLSLHDSHLLIHSDNQGVIEAYKKGRSRNFEVNLSIRRSGPILLANNLSISIQYIESIRNPADPISRGDLGPESLRLETTIQLPSELRPFIAHV